MQVRKVKTVIPKFASNTGPYEIVTLGMAVDNIIIEFGTYYFGPGMEERHEKLFKKYEEIIDEIVKKLNSKNSQIEQLLTSAISLCKDMLDLIKNVDFSNGIEAFGTNEGETKTDDLIKQFEKQYSDLINSINYQKDI